MMQSSKMEYRDQEGNINDEVGQVGPVEPESIYPISHLQHEAATKFKVFAAKWQ